MGAPVPPRLAAFIVRKIQVTLQQCRRQSQLNTLKMQVAVTAKHAKGAQLNALKVQVAVTAKHAEGAQLNTLKVQVAITAEHTQGAGNNHS